MFCWDTWTPVSADINVVAETSTTQHKRLVVKARETEGM